MGDKSCDVKKEIIMRYMENKNINVYNVNKEMYAKKKEIHTRNTKRCTWKIEINVKNRWMLKIDKWEKSDKCEI